MSTVGSIYSRSLPVIAFLAGGRILLRNTNTRRTTAVVAVTAVVLAIVLGSKNLCLTSYHMAPGIDVPVYEVQRVRKLLYGYNTAVCMHRHEEEK